MTPRSFVVLLLLAATASAPAKELSGRALKKFLGPVSLNLITWKKSVERGVEIYHGDANPPLSGTIYIFICEGCSVFGGGGDGQEPFGAFPSFLTRGRSEDGQFYAGGVHWIDQQRFFEVDIKTEAEADRDKLVAQISRLPMFNAAQLTPFSGIMMRKNIAHFVDWLFFPFLFLLSVWLPDRYLRRRKASGLRRALTASGIFAAWITLSYGLFIVSRLSRPAGAILYVEYSSLITPALALVCFAVALLVVIWLLVRRFVISRFARGG